MILIHLEGYYFIKYVTTFRTTGQNLHFIYQHKGENDIKGNKCEHNLIKSRD